MEGTGNAGEGKEWWKGMRVFSPEYYAVCAIGGMLSAGTTHLAITPLDVLKVNMQVRDSIDPLKRQLFSFAAILPCCSFVSKLACIWGKTSEVGILLE